MLDFAPSWTNVGSWTLGRDPLGMQATSVRLYRTLVPGLTNVTNRLRYFSFYCWAVETYEQTVHSHDVRKWARFIRRAEALYALASVCVDDANSDGMAGALWARRWKNDLGDGTLDFRPATDNKDSPDAYLSAPRGNFGQFYIASMIEEGMLERSSNVPIVSEGLGRELGEAFRKSVGESAELMAEAMKSGIVDVADLETIGKTAHPSCIPQASQEMKLLRGYLLCERVGTEASKERRQSAWLLLDLMRQGVDANAGIAIREAFYNRRLPDGTAYGQAGATIDRWRAFQANEFAHIALEALLNGLLSLQIHTFPNGVGPEALIREFLERVEPSALLSGRTWMEWALERGTELVGQEEALAAILLPALQSPDALAADVEVWSAAISLIGVLYARWSSGEGGVRDTVERAAAGGGKSIAGLLRTLRDRETESAIEAMVFALRRHVIADHLAIAGRKLSASGTFTYHFTLADGVINDGRLSAYGYTTPRIANLVRFLRDARLCEESEVTTDGLRFLNDHQPV